MNSGREASRYIFSAVHRQAKVRRSLVLVCTNALFIAQISSFSPKSLETRCHFGSGCKTVNSQGYSELREPIKTRENCYSPIWQKLKPTRRKRVSLHSMAVLSGAPLRGEAAKKARKMRELAIKPREK